jgi:hypothetical protein
MEIGGSSSTERQKLASVKIEIKQIHFQIIAAKGSDLFKNLLIIIRCSIVGTWNSLILIDNWVGCQDAFV